jgi:hypothetical protein
MKNKIDLIDAGLLFGLLFGVFHLSWLVLILTNYAQPVLDFIFWAHFIKPVLEVESFEAGRALILLAITVCIGFTLGYLLAIVLNKLSSNEVEIQ